MKVLDPGHSYKLDSLDGDSGDCEILEFVKREGEGYPGNKGHYPGTNCQEVLRVLIDRIKYLDNQITDPRNDNIIEHLRSCLRLLEVRAADRHKRSIEPIWNYNGNVEDAPYCKKCGHIGCKGKCHK